MNIKHQPLLRMFAQKVLSNATIVKFPHVHLHNTQKHSNQQHCSEQLQSRVWTTSLIMETFPYMLSADRAVVAYCVLTITH